MKNEIESKIYHAGGEWWAECPNKHCPTHWISEKYIAREIAEMELREHNCWGTGASLPKSRS